MTSPERTDKYGGDLTGGVVFGLLQKQVRLFIADNWVFGVLQEPVDFGLKIDDVLVGSF